MAHAIIDEELKVDIVEAFLTSDKYPLKRELAKKIVLVVEALNNDR